MLLSTKWRRIESPKMSRWRKALLQQDAPPLVGLHPSGMRWYLSNRKFSITILEYVIQEMGTRWYREKVAKSILASTHNFSSFYFSPVSVPHYLFMWSVGLNLSRSLRLLYTLFFIHSGQRNATWTILAAHLVLSGKNIGWNHCRFVRGNLLFSVHSLATSVSIPCSHN